MPWQIKFHDSRPEQPRVGDCWHDHELIEGENREYMKQFFLAPEYFEKHYGKRAPLWVVLPDKTYFCVDSRVIDGGKVGDHGWSVSGEPWHGNLTVSPSINIVGSYHGFIKNNEIGDDVDGRKFPFAERPDEPISIEGAPEPSKPAAAVPFWKAAPGPAEKISPDVPFWKMKK